MFQNYLVTKLLPFFKYVVSPFKKFLGQLKGYNECEDICEDFISMVFQIMLVIA